MNSEKVKNFKFEYVKPRIVSIFDWVDCCSGIDIISERAGGSKKKTT